MNGIWVNMFPRLFYYKERCNKHPCICIFGRDTWLQVELLHQRRFSVLTGIVKSVWKQNQFILSLKVSIHFFHTLTILHIYREKAMAPHSSTLAWKISWVEEPGRLQSMGSRRVGHDWATSLSFFTFMHWRTKWQPTPVFLPGESQGWGSPVSCRLWGRTDLDTTEAT